MRRIHAGSSIWSHFLISMALAISAIACDTQHDRDNDQDLQDASTDTDVDSDTSTECETVECMYGDLPCCKPEGCDLKPAGAVCDEQYRADYSCLVQDPGCGSNIYVRFQRQLCDGISPYCRGEITDWGDWEIDRTCRPFEVCLGNSANIILIEESIKCVSDVELCPVEFDDLVCFKGDEMPDCPTSGCPDPPPSLVETVTMSEVADSEPGEVVLLEIFASDRFSINVQGEPVSPKPFTDIRGTISHDGYVVPFYNNYASDHSYSDWFGERYRFPVQWYLPQFWGEHMSGKWEIFFEDSGFSGMGEQPFPFEIKQWCLRFIDPALTEIETGEKEWKIEYDPTSDNPVGFIEEGVNYFEIHIDDIYFADYAAPLLHLDVVHDVPSSISIDLVAGNGVVVPVKDKHTDFVPEWTEIFELLGEWLTGRYQLRITSDDANTGGTNKVNSWSISVTESDIDGGGGTGGENP
jgi:hypothetical protein